MKFDYEQRKRKIISCSRKEWRLESVPHVSPLDGALRFQLNCHSESQVPTKSFFGGSIGGVQRYRKL